MSTELQTFPMHDICSFKMTNNDFILAIVAFIITLGSLICVCVWGGGGGEERVSNSEARSR